MSETLDQVTRILGDRKAFKMEYIDNKGKKTIRIVAPHMTGKCGESDKVLCVHVKGGSSSIDKYDPTDYKKAYRHFTIDKIAILEIVDKEYKPLIGYFDYWFPTFIKVYEHVPEQVDNSEVDDGIPTDTEEENQ